mgnify:CR=1 FL=1
MDIRPLGALGYAETWGLQMELLQQRIRGEIEDTLLIVEHPDVITLGRKFPGLNDLVASGTKEWQGLPLFFVERGGEATYHGPGQLVMYPIFQLPESRGPRAFLRFLEEVLIDLLQVFDIDAFRIEDATGVWLRDGRGRERKIASLGIAARSFVSYHGLALNVATNLDQFRKITPCGYAPEVMTSMREVLGEKSPPLSSVSERLAEKIKFSFPLWGNEK